MSLSISFPLGFSSSWEYSWNWWGGLLLKLWIWHCVDINGGHWSCSNVSPTQQNSWRVDPSLCLSCSPPPPLVPLQHSSLHFPPRPGWDMKKSSTVHTCCNTLPQTRDKRSHEWTMATFDKRWCFLGLILVLGSTKTNLLIPECRSFKSIGISQLLLTTFWKIPFEQLFNNSRL